MFPGDPGHHQSDDEEAQTDDEKILGETGPVKQGTRYILKNETDSNEDNDDSQQLIILQTNHCRKYLCRHYLNTGERYPPPIHAGVWFGCKPIWRMAEVQLFHTNFKKIQSRFVNLARVGGGTLQ